MRFSFIHHSRQEDIFVPGCLDDRIGEEVTFRKDMGGSYTGTLVAAKVLNKGQALEITLDIPDEAGEGLEGVTKGLSMGFEVDTCDRHVPGFGRCGLTRAHHTVDRVNHPFT